MPYYRILLVFLLIGGLSPFGHVSAQNFRAMEYFWGKDPGIGKGTRGQLNGNHIDSFLSLESAVLNPGLHYLSIRMLSDSNLWSPYTQYLISIEDSIQDSFSIIKSESFYGKDPGLGKGLSFSFGAGVNQLDTIIEWPADSTTGLISCAFRMQSESKLWSPFAPSLLMINEDSFRYTITDVEYFNGKDPGAGKGNPISLSTSVTDTIIEIPTTETALSRMSFRLRGNASLWTSFESALLSYSPENVLSPLAHWAKSIDSIPRFSRSDSIRTSSYAHTLTDTLNIRLDSRTGIGKHEVWLRAQDSLQRSGIWVGDTFAVIHCPMLDTGTFSVQGGFCAGDTLILREQITPLGIWPADSFHFSWYMSSSSTVLGQADTLRLPVSNTGLLEISLKYERKGDRRCTDSISREIRIHPVYQDTLHRSICAGDSVLLFGTFQKTSGTYTQNIKSIRGCDSTTVTILQVNPVYNDTISRRICSGDSSFIHGTFRKISGDYVFNGSTGKGCDSISVIRLTIDSAYQFRDTFRLCSGDTLNIHGKQYTAAGTFADSFRTRFGCDSVYISTIRILPTYLDSSEQRICSGDSAFIHGKFERNPADYSLLTKSIDFCDSISVIRLTVLPVYSISLRDTLCQDDSLSIHGTFRRSAGIYDSTYRTIQGCDSFVRRILTVNPRYTLNDTFRICNGDSVKVHDKTFKSAGTFQTAFRSSLNCDSTYQTTLIVHPTYSRNIFVGLCGGDSIAFDGIFRDRTGIYTGLFKTTEGCDSTVRLHLTVDSIIQMYPEFEICEGDSVFLEGEYQKQSGVYTDYYQAAKGCDSIVYSTLVVNPHKSLLIHDTICFGNNYVFNGITYTQSGTYEAPLKTFKGCDSLVVLHLFVHPENKRSQAFDLCTGDSVPVAGRFLKAAGFYSDTLRDQNGCDSVVETRINLLRRDQRLVIDTLCFKDSIVLDGRIIRRSGTYFESLKNEFNCDSIIEYRLFFRPRISVQIQAVGFDEISTTRPFKTYQWYLDRQLLPGETRATIRVTKGGIYDVEVSDSLDCPGSSMDDLSASDSPEPNIYPEVFPNPGTGYFSIVNRSQHPLSYQISNQMGVVIMESDCPYGTHLLDLSHQASGIYNITFSNANTRLTRKIILIR